VTPDQVPTALINLCQKYQFHNNATCISDFNATTFGAIWTQVLAYADVSGLDGRYICNSWSSTFCSQPPAYPVLNTTSLFPKPKPSNAKVPMASGERVKVLHLSDFHLDPRYAVASEANCSSGLCCRTNAVNTHVAAGQVSLPAPLYGSFLCDTPYFLGTGALQAIHPLTGTENSSSNLGWTIYTGDLTSHDPINELSRAYVEYAETSTYQLFHTFLRGPVFAVLGNHDTNPSAQDAPHSLPDPLGQQLSWNYDHVAGLWQNEGWLSPTAAAQARTHYGGYSVKNNFGLRIITLNTDFWYRANLFNFINTTNPDVSGMQAWLISELQAAEDSGERVWILGHVLTGWDGSNPLPNPTELFYAIVERYSPHVIANVFFGHTHEDELMIYYANNGTNRNTVQGLGDSLATGWIGPSVTPLTNLNSGFRMYEVDTGSFEVYEAYTWYADVAQFPGLDTQREGPVYRIEYSTREAYGAAAGWPQDAPLNATFWHQVSEAMLDEAAAAVGNVSGSAAALLPLTQRFNSYQGKMSVREPKCDTVACARAKVCYMRSGSAALGRECSQG